MILNIFHSLTGSVVNFFAIIIGTLIGLIFKKGIPKKVSSSVNFIISLCILYIGIKGSLDGKNTLILIISMVIGTLIGEIVDLDKHLHNFADSLESKLKSDKTSNFSQGFVTSTLIFCVGAMAIVGSVQSGLNGNFEVLFSKSLLDGIISVILASSLGFGVIGSAFAVFLYQGLITLLAHLVSPFLTNEVIHEMNCVGSLLIVGLSLNMMHITNIKIVNHIPSIFMPIILCIFM